MSSYPSPLSSAIACKERYLSLTPHDNHDRDLLDRLTITAATVSSDGEVGSVTYNIKIPSKYCNHFGTVHGGAIATLFDDITSCVLSVLPRKGAWNGMEVSRSLQVRFFRPVQPEELLDAFCEIVHVGKTLANIRGSLRRHSDGRLLATCSHEKFCPVTASGAKQIGAVRAKL